MNKWMFVLLLGFGMHLGASYLVPLDQKAQAEFAGLIRWFWPWSYGDKGLLGKISPGPNGFPIVGFFIAVTSATLFLLAILSLFHLWVPLSWLRPLTIAGAVVSILLMILFFGPTKVLPIIFNLLLIYYAWNNMLPKVR